MPQTIVRRYKTERAMQNGVVQMGSSGWRVVSQSSYTPKKGFIRWLAGGFIFFNRRPEHLVTFEATEGALPMTATSAVIAISQEETTALTQQWQETYAAHMESLSTPAKWLHQKPIAIGALVVYCALILAGLRWEGVFDVALVLTLALAFVDWTGLRTLHGRVNWPLFRAQHPSLYWWSIIGLVLFFMVPGIAYFIGCLSGDQQ